jgi:hypothetical protein
MMTEAGSASAVVSTSWSPTSLLAGRIPLAVFLPAVVHILSCWYRRRELAKCIAFFSSLSIASHLLFVSDVREPPTSCGCPAVYND